MEFKHLLESLPLVGNVFRCVPREQSQGAHCLQDAEHFIVWTKCPSVRKNAIVGGLQVFGDKASERVKESWLPRRYD